MYIVKTIFFYLKLILDKSNTYDWINFESLIPYLQNLEYLDIRNNKITRDSFMYNLPKLNCIILSLETYKHLKLKTWISWEVFLQDKNTIGIKYSK